MPAFDLPYIALEDRQPFHTVSDVPVPLMDTRCAACGRSFGQHYGDTGIICPDSPIGRVSTFAVSVFNDQASIPRQSAEYDALVRLFQPLVDRAQEARAEAQSMFAGLAEEVASDIGRCACGDGCSCGDFDEPEQDEPYDDSFVSDSCTCVDCIAASQYVGEVS